MRSLWVLCFLLLSGCQACKGDPEKCDQACRNYAQLVYWEKANQEIEALPVEQRDEARKEKLAKFAHDLERGVDFCTNKCISANNTDSIDCMIAAKNAAQAKKCSDD